jgi:hypothetical protein
MRPAPNSALRLASALVVALGTALGLAASDVSSADPVPASEPAAVHVSGDVEHAGEWTAERLAHDFAADVREIEIPGKASAKARCVPLLSLIQAAAPKIDPVAKGQRLGFAAVVRGRDGYAVTFSLGELLPEHGGRAIWLALDHDGKPLDSAHAPVELVVPADEKRSRWVRGVASVTILDVGRLAAK